ncbi:MAG TPA: VWA domain-containing protein, partial [Vicinamibacterales bacterium]|nr:VWA domain-containing protein [Vicinamibacterales bacterium]
MRARHYAAVAVVLALGASPRLAAQQAPVFSSSVEVTSIDATVVDDRGKPVSDLQPGDFSVRVDGSQRRVVSVQWVPLATGPAAAVAPVPAGYTGNQNATPGRLIVLAIDQPHIPFGGSAVVLGTMGGFIDRLEPSDRISAVALGAGGAIMPFTSDRARVKQALGEMNGGDHDDDLPAQHDVSLAESIQIGNGNASTIDDVVGRECAGLTAVQRGVCANQVASDAAGKVQTARTSTAETIVALRALLQGLARVDAPKTVILVSERLPMVDQEVDLVELGALAGSARASIYVLQLDAQAVNTQMKRAGQVRVEDRLITGAGLDLLATASRGSLMRVSGDGKVQFDRIASELSGYYLLGLETDAKDRDGRPHAVNVSVSRRGTTVRSRRQLPVAAVEAAKKDMAPKDAVVAALTSPFLVSSLPLRVATFSVREPESSKVQVIVHADIGADYANTEPVSVGYTLVDEKTGRQVIGEEADARLSPVMRGVPSSLQFVTSISVDPGDYRLTMAAADGDRVGTVEHRVHAGLVPAGAGLSLSELMVGGPTSATVNRLRPSVGYSVAFGVLQAYIEAYGPTDTPPAVKYEVASAADGPALLQASASPVTAGDQRTIFNEMFRIGDLPAGSYVLRALVSARGNIVKTLTRPFEIDAPAVLMTSAAAPTATTTATDVYLPVADDLFARKFQRESAARGETLRAFRATVAEPVR